MGVLRVWDRIGNIDEEEGSEVDVEVDSEKGREGKQRSVFRDLQAVECWTRC